MREPGSPERLARAKRIAGGLGVPSCSDLGEGHVGIEVLDLAMIELPGVIESGMPRRNGQRKLGTTRGSPRRSRTAKALRISRFAVKSRCARGWDGWGRLSDDGSRQHNSDRSEDPWGGGLLHLHGGARSCALGPTLCGITEVATRCAKGETQTKHQSVYAGSRLKLVDVREGAALHASLPAVSGKTRRTE